MSMHTRLIQRLAGILPSRRLLGIGLAALTLCLVTPRTEAQLGLGMMGGETAEMFKPLVNGRALKEYAAILSLTPEQKRAAEDLLGVYEIEFRAAITRMEEVYQSIQEEINDSGDYELYQSAIPSAMLKFINRSEAISATFMNDLKSLLDNKQLEYFPLLERMQRRTGFARVGLEGVQKIDLFDIVRGLRLDSAGGEGSAAILEQYAVELDRELTSRSNIIRTFIRSMVEKMENGDRPQEDPTFFEKWMKDLNDANQRVATLNNKYIPMVRSAIPESSQATYDEQVKLSKYPSIYKKSYATRVFEAVEKMKDLDATQVDGIKAIKETYLRDAGAANDKWAVAYDDILNAIPPEQRAMGGGMWQIRGDPRYTEGREARKAIDTRAVESVKALLTEAQRALLPKPGYRPEWDFDHNNPQ